MAANPNLTTQVSTIWGGGRIDTYQVSEEPVGVHARLGTWPQTAGYGIGGGDLWGNFRTNGQSYHQDFLADDEGMVVYADLKNIGAAWSDTTDGKAYKLTTGGGLGPGGTDLWIRATRDAAWVQYPINVGVPANLGQNPQPEGRTILVRGTQVWVSLASGVYFCADPETTNTWAQVAGAGLELAGMDWDNITLGTFYYCAFNVNSGTKTAGVYRVTVNAAGATLTDVKLPTGASGDAMPTRPYEVRCGWKGTASWVFVAHSTGVARYSTATSVWTNITGTLPVGTAGGTVGDNVQWQSLAVKCDATNDPVVAVGATNDIAGPATVTNGKVFLTATSLGTPAWKRIDTAATVDQTVYGDSSGDTYFVFPRVSGMRLAEKLHIASALCWAAQPGSAIRNALTIFGRTVGYICDTPEAATWTSKVAGKGMSGILGEALCWDPNDGAKLLATGGDWNALYSPRHMIGKMPVHLQADTSVSFTAFIDTRGVGYVGGGGTGKTGSAGGFFGRYSDLDVEGSTGSQSLTKISLPGSGARVVGHVSFYLPAGVSGWAGVSAGDCVTVVTLATSGTSLGGTYMRVDTPPTPLLNASNAANPWAAVKAWAKVAAYDGNTSGKAQKVKFVVGTLSGANGYIYGLSGADGLIRSSDYGRTWTVISTLAKTTLTQYLSLDNDPTAPDRLYFNGGGNVYRVTDGTVGAPTVTQLTGPASVGKVNQVACYNAGDAGRARLYVAFAAQSTPRRPMSLQYADDAHTGSTATWVDATDGGVRRLGIGAIEMKASIDGTLAIAAQIGPGVHIASPGLADTTAPTVPGTPTAVAVTGSAAVDVSWAGSTDTQSGVATYTVYRSTTSGGSFTQTGTVAAPATAYRDSTSAGATVYYWKVDALDAAGNRSAKSAVSAAVTTNATATAPDVPAGVTATAVAGSGRQVTVGWTANAAGVTVASYGVYVGGVKVTNVTSGTSYIVTGLTASTAYAFTVTAVSAAGNESAQSTAANATTGSGAPSAPTTVTDTVLGSTSVRVDWSGAASVDSTIAGYNVQRQTAGTGAYTQVNTALVVGTTWTDTGLAASTAYRHKVVTVDALALTSAASTASSSVTTTATGVAGPTAALTLNAVSFTAGTVMTADSSQSAQGSALITSRVYSWGDGTSDLTTTAVTATHVAGYDAANVPLAAGTYTVTVTVTDANSRTATATIMYAVVVPFVRQTANYGWQLPPSNSPFFVADPANPTSLSWAYTDALTAALNDADVKMKANADAIAGSSGFWTPASNGSVAASINPLLATATYIPTAGTMALVRMTAADASAAVTKVKLHCIGAGVTLTNVYAIVYDCTTGAQVAVSADLSAVAGAGGLLSAGLKRLVVSSFVPVVGRDYYAALLIGTAGTTPTFPRVPTPPTAIVNDIPIQGGHAQYLAPLYVVGNTIPPTSLVDATMNAGTGGSIIYAALEV